MFFWDTVYLEQLVFVADFRGNPHSSIVQCQCEMNIEKVAAVLQKNLKFCESIAICPQ